MAGATAGPVSCVALDGLTRTAARALDAPVVCLSLVDADRRLLTGSYGLPTPSALLVSWWFMRHVVATGRPLVLPDARRHPTAARNPAVRDGTVTAYVGMPLIASNGRAVGTLSIMDRKPRPWSEPQLELVRRLSARVVKAVEAENGTRSPLAAMQ